MAKQQKAKLQLIGAREATAAQLLDMPVAQFRRLVAQGALPPPVLIGDLKRWSVAQIEAILSGKNAIPKEDFEL